MEKQFKALGEIVQTDRALARLAETDKLTKAVTREVFLERVNNGIQPLATAGLWNPKISELAKGSWDGGTFTWTIHNKDGALVEEDAEYTDGSNPEKRNKHRRVRMHVSKRKTSEKNGYRIEPSIETGMFNPMELADATSNELQAHNLYKDRAYFNRLGAYVGTNFEVIARNADVTTSYDPVLAKIAELTGDLKDGFDFAGNSYIGEHPTISNGDVEVIGTHTELTKLAALYLTEKGVGSNKQFDEFKNGTSETFTFANLTFRAIPLVSMTARTDKKLLIGAPTAGEYAEVRFFIQTTGMFSPVGGKFTSRVFTGEIPLNFGDIAVQSILYDALTGTDFDGENGEIYKDHVFAILAEAPAVPVLKQEQNPTPATMKKVEE